MRLFIAALLPDGIVLHLSKYINSLKTEIEGVKWEKPEKLHVTLKFLGNVDDSKVAEILDLIATITAECDSFQVSLTEFGAFPNLKNPKVFYIGLAQNKVFSKFQMALERDLSKLGYEKEDHKFTPHITLGRVKKRVRIGMLPTRQKNFQINQIALIESKLRFEGSAYSIVKIYDLSG